jgi:hypothetical protein
MQGREFLVLARELLASGEVLGKHRNAASYDLSALPIFASAKRAQTEVQLAGDALTLLDANNGDPARRTAAIGSIRP